MQNLQIDNHARSLVLCMCACEDKDHCIMQDKLTNRLMLLVSARIKFLFMVVGMNF